MLYLVCDGHLGVDAASFVEETFVQFLTPLIPPTLPDFKDKKGTHDNPLTTSQLSHLLFPLLQLSICLQRSYGWPSARFLS